MNFIKVKEITSVTTVITRLNVNEIERYSPCFIGKAETVIYFKNGSEILCAEKAEEIDKIIYESQNK